MHLNAERKPVTMADAGEVSDGRDENRYGGDEDFDSACSTPFVSAPSSPTRSGGGLGPSGYFFSAPASPVHYVLSSSSSYRENKKESVVSEDLTDFEFASRNESTNIIGSGAMSSADELFLNGKIRPMKLSSHLQKPQVLTPLLDLDENDGCDAEFDEKETETETIVMMRGRDFRIRNRSLHRKTRSLSPLRNPHLDEVVQNDVASIKNPKSIEIDNDEPEVEAVAVGMSSSSRSSSSGSRNSKKWIYLKDLLYRSKSEGQATAKEKFWPSISFSPSKDKRNKKTYRYTPSQRNHRASENSIGKAVNGSVSMRRVPARPSAHELHYTANRAQAEEMKKKTYLPYKQGLFGCLGFSSKGYGVLQGFAKTLNPVSSR